MSQKTNPKTQTQPPQHLVPKAAPIPDVNGNSILDVEDIVTQMAVEEQDQTARTVNEPAHGIFEMLGMRQWTKEIQSMKDEGVPLPADALDQIATDLKQSMAKFVPDIRSYLDKDPDYRAKFLETLAARGKEKGMPPEYVDLAVADSAHLIDFADTFFDTFPKGVALNGGDMPLILGHFIGDLVPSTTPATPEAPAPSKKRD